MDYLKLGILLRASAEKIGNIYYSFADSEEMNFGKKWWVDIF